jgi:PAS domain S-box-containing protein
MNPAELSQRYADLQRYVGWTDDDVRRIAAAANCIRPQIDALIADFYAEIQRHPRAAAVITGGPEQVERLKGTLARWIDELLAGPYDADYVQRRARVGMKHVEIGLEQVYTNLAFARLRAGMMTAVRQAWQGPADERAATILSLNKLIDLDLAVITAVYEAEHVAREQAAVRASLEGALRQQREFSESLLENAHAIVLVLDLAGNVLRMNSYLQRLTGLSEAGAEGREWLPLLLPDEDHRLARRELIERLAHDPSAGGLATTGLLGPNHTRRQVRWSSTLLRDPARQPFALLLIGQDVTDLLEAQERALRAERLAAIGQMVAGLAHEARNALQRIQACAEMLQLELQDRPEALGFVQRIEHAQSHVHRLFDEVRTYAGPVHLDRTHCRLAALWREAWDLLAAQRQGRAATLEESPGCDDWEVHADRFRLVQVFRNVLENSLAACSDPVKIVVVCEPAQLSAAAAVRISLRDNGPGLSPEQQQRIFEPFYTTKTKGTGLGMAIAQRWIEAHGGTIEVEPSTAGAAIAITLPLSSP